MSTQDPPGFVTRADIALADRNLDLIKKTTERVSADLKELPTVHYKAARELALFAQMQRKHGGVSVKHHHVWLEQVHTLRSAYVETLDQMAAEAGIDPRSPHRRAIMGEMVNPVTMNNAARRAHSLRARATRLRQILVQTEAIQWRPNRWAITHKVPNVAAVEGVAQVIGGFDAGPQLGWGGIQGGRRWHMPATFAPWFWGPRGTPRGWAVDQWNGASRRLRKLPGMLAGFGAGYLMNLGYSSIGMSEDYAIDMYRVVTQRNLWQKNEHGSWSGADPWYSKAYKSSSLGVLSLRDTMERMGRGWLMTGREALGAIKGLKYQFNEDRALAVAHYSRQTGGDGAQVGGQYERLLRYIRGRHISVTPVSPGEPAPMIRKGSQETGWTWEHQRTLVGGTPTAHDDNSMLAHILQASHQAGMRSRIGHFMGDVEAIGRVMGSGQGLASQESVIGWAATMGAAGFRGPRWRGVSAGVLSASAAPVGDVMGAARIAALRRHGGASGVREARAGISSRSPKTVLAYMRYARDESGGDDQIARHVFQRLLGGKFNTTQVDMLWEKSKELEGWEGAGKYDPDFNKAQKVNGQWERVEGWLAGPLYEAIHRIKGNEVTQGTWGSVARVRAETDWVKHRLGRRIIDTAENLKSAAVSGAQALEAGRGPLETLGEIAANLNGEARTILGMRSLAKGDLGRAAFWLTGAASAFSASGVPPSLPPVPTMTNGGGDGVASPNASYPAPTGRPAGALDRAEAGYRASEVGADLDTYTMAVVAFSESNGTHAENVAVMQTLLNRSDTSGRDIFREATGRMGVMGAQTGGARPYATSRMPTGATMTHLLGVARDVRQAWHRGERGGGITNFMHPEAQRAAHRRNPARSSPPEAVDLRWRRRGLQRMTPAGTGTRPDSAWFYAPNR